MAHEELHLNLRNLTLDDYEQLQVLMDRVYDDIGVSSRNGKNRTLRPLQCS